MDLRWGGGTGILTGSAFAPDTAVKIGDNPATDVVITPTLIYFTIPPGTIGTVDVTVTTPDGREWILENGVHLRSISPSGHS